MSEVKISEGYKKTEVGVIPKDWEVKELGSQSLKIGSGSDSKDKNGIYPLYGSTGIIGKSKCFSYNQKSILVARVGANAGLVNLVNGKYGVSDNTIVINLNNNNDVDFIKSWLIKKDLNTLVFGSGQPLITGTQLKKLLIALPPKSEQTAIATALSDVDNLIGSLERLIAKKEAIKTGTMQQLLTGKTRLPEFATREDGSAKGFKQTELGQIPEDWDLVSVRETCDFLTGFPFPSSKYQESGIKLLRGSNVKRGNTNWSDNITKFWADSTSGIEQYLLQEADIVISMDGSLVGRSFAQLSDTDLPALLLQRVARLRSKSISQDYLKEWVCSPVFSDYCDSVKTVTAIPHISPADILNFRLFVPSTRKEQTAIATILSNMDAETQALQERLAKTHDIKQGMMQQLLTGKVRLAY